jgi:hypothetical protein
VFGGLWSKICQFRQIKLLRKTENIFRGGASAVKEHDGSLR